MKAVITALLFASALVASAAWAQNVKITPVGTHPGELCDRDRATIFEDPTGVRILYDAGQSITGADDPRLGDIHVVLLSHAHGDHIGDRKLKALGAGSCAKPETVPDAPNGTTAEVAAAKGAAIVMIAPMGAFVAKKMEHILGKPVGNCAASGGAISVPPASACSASQQLGGTRVFKAAGADKGVEITIVAASHDSTVSRALLTDQGKKNADADAVSYYLGPPSGYIIRFTNGLTVYASGDTGLHTEMQTVIGAYHKPNLALMNLGPNAIDPKAAGHAINDMVKPATVIATHVNEAATSGGKLNPKSRTAAFIKEVKGGRPVYLAISGKTMEFDGSAACVAGCQ